MTAEYLKNRERLLNCTNDDIGLPLTKDTQVYIAAVDIPTKSSIVGNEVVTLGMVFLTQYPFVL